MNDSFRKVIEALQEGDKAEQRGESAKALNQAGEALLLSRAEGITEGVALAALDVGKRVRPVDPETAIMLYQESLQAALAVGFDDIVVLAWRNTGSAYSQLGKLDLAENSLREAVHLSRSLDDEQELIASLNNLVVVLILQRKVAHQG